MSLRKTCPRGHQWESADDPAVADTMPASICPICGSAADAATSSVEEDWPRLGGDLPPLPQPLSVTRTPQLRSWPAIGGYEILGELGRGGMGVVFKARQQNLDRLVALKMLLPDSGAGPAEVARFRREAEAVAALRQANFVHIYDFGEHDQRPYFVMEYVDGGSLAQRLAGQPLPWRQAAQLLATLARAMHAAHQCGIVHRDLKPTNILLMADGTPKIADFGLAKKLGRSADLTGSDAIVGTPNYMAPEQALGQSRDIGPAADIHALGAILYEALTGRPPFKGTSALDTLQQVANQAPLPPRRLRAEIPDALEEICLRCLEKEPSKRHASAADLAEALEHLLAGRPDPWRGKAGRRYLPILIGVGAVVLVSAGLAWHWWPTPEAEPDQSRPAGVQGLASNKDSPKKDQPGPEGPPAKDRRPTELATIPWRAGKLLALALAPDGKTLALGGESNFVELWDVQSEKRTANLRGHPGNVFSLAYAPEGKRLAVGSSNKIWLWDLEPERHQDNLEGHSRNVTRIWYGHDGKTLITASDNEAIVFGVKPDAKPVILKGGNWVFFPDRKTLGRLDFAQLGSALDLWDITAPQESVRIGLGLTPYLGTLTAAGSGDGRRVAVGQDDCVTVWNAVTTLQLVKHTAHSARVTAVDLTRDGETVVSGSKDKSAILWQVTANKKRARLEGHTGPVLVRLSPDGRTLATSSVADTFVKLWEVATGKELASLTGHTATVEGVEFSPNGRILAVRCHDQTVKVWDVASVTSAGQ
jgi:serine/threonine protein kinase